jgi:hypothetical protein
MVRWSIAIALPGALGCIALTPDGARVAVYQAPLEGPAAKREMPADCRLVSSTTPVSMTELEMQGSDDPFRVQRNEAAAAGANTVLVLSKETQSRRTMDCPSSMRITDCLGSSGAWYRVTFENYACTSQALDSLSPPPAPRPTGSRKD